MVRLVSSWVVGGWVDGWLCVGYCQSQASESNRHRKMTAGTYCDPQSYCQPRTKRFNHCRNTLYHTLQDTATHRATDTHSEASPISAASLKLQHTAIHCNTLLHTATNRATASHKQESGIAAASAKLHLQRPWRSNEIHHWYVHHWYATKPINMILMKECVCINADT